MVSDVMTTAWNFVLTGEVRSGAGVIQSSINNRKGVVCHACLFDRDDAVRRAAHEAYFGESKDPERMPEWYVEGFTNPWQYINHTILEPRKGETATGFHLPYSAVRSMELYDLFEQKHREGGFSIIEVIRNPVACFISLKQAEKSGVWSQTVGTVQRTRPPQPVRIDAKELTEFCREHEATLSKIRATCEDRLEIQYRDLVLDYQGVMRQVFDHVELPEAPVWAKPGRKRLRNRVIRSRVSNWAELRMEAPSDVKTFIDSEDLF